MRYDVPAEARGLTLGRFLYDRLKLSRTLIRRAKQVNGLLVNGQPATTRFLLQGGEQVELRLPAGQGRVAPEAMALAVIYEDAYLLVVDKPAGVVVHPVRGYQAGTLAGGVAQYLLERGEEPVARPVQRLDKETSGLLLFAKDPAVAGRLAAELERNKLERRYRAVVQGRVEPELGSMTVPIRRVWGHPVAREAAVGLRRPEQEALLAGAEAAGQRLREEWKAAGQAAVTHYAVIQRLKEATLLELRLQTGRTHQIRVHLAHMGHPVLGDQLYGSGGPPGRQALHAASLLLVHPVTGARLRFDSPLPADIQSLLRSLQ